MGTRKPQRKTDVLSVTENELRSIRDIRVRKKIEYAPVLAGRRGVSWYHLLSRPLPASPPSRIFQNGGRSGWGHLGQRCNGRIPGSLTTCIPTRATTLELRVLSQPFTQGTGGEFTAWLPASHQTGRSLNSCADTCLRAGLSIGWIIPNWRGMSSFAKLV
jgi:hypothetical protein